MNQFWPLEVATVEGKINWNRANKLEFSLSISWKMASLLKQRPRRVESFAANTKVFPRQQAESHIIFDWSYYHNLMGARRALL